MAIWLLALALVTPPRHAHKAKAHHRTARAARAHHDGSISTARATQIQKALVHAGYLSKTSGHWDATTVAALKKFQEAHHWQTRFVPDARALLALGLVKTSAPEEIALNGGR